MTARQNPGIPRHRSIPGIRSGPVGEQPCLYPDIRMRSRLRLEVETTEAGKQLLTTENTDQRKKMGSDSN